jgi:hypothetical protein
MVRHKLSRVNYVDGQAVEPSQAILVNSLQGASSRSLLDTGLNASDGRGYPLPRLFPTLNCF